MKRNFMSIDVMGGSEAENDQMVAMIHTFLVEKGFTNVSSRRQPDAPAPHASLADMIRARNPELFDTPIQVSGECDDDLAMQEDAVFLSMMPMPPLGRFGLATH